ncbi:hypothetical protein HPP92_018674 [Vanilla planifolia]|uniref:Uncharacterized protein n=1 Tax=Vanilla planifolia TaxID=51239 RepID=A0A835URS5_VANPL|nr:hypothetical protein HPP92_018674 [Vanilla planifolia]
MKSLHFFHQRWRATCGGRQAVVKGDGTASICGKSFSLMMAGLGGFTYLNSAMRLLCQIIKI